MNRNKKSGGRKTVSQKGSDAFSKDISQEQYDELAKEVDKLRSRKPGSQSSGSSRHHNGRGGGK